MSSSGGEQSRNNSLLNNSSTSNDSYVGDNFESLGQLLTSANAEKARLIRELDKQTEETRQMRMERDEFKSQLFQLQQRYMQSNDRLYKEMTRSDGKADSKNTLAEAEEQLRKKELAIEGRLKEANENIKRLKLEKQNAENQLAQTKERMEIKSEQVNKLDRDLTEAKIKLEQEEKLHLEKQNKLQDDLQKAKDQSEETIKQLQADMMKTEAEVEKLRATISEMEKNRAEITTKFETLKREHAELATKAIQEKEKKIKQLRAELKRTEGENCGKPDKLMAKIAEKEKNNPEKSGLDSNTNAKLVSPTKSGGSGSKPIVHANSNDTTRKRTWPADRIAFDGALSSNKRNKDEVTAEHSQTEPTKIMSKIYAIDWVNAKNVSRFEYERNEWEKIDFGGALPQRTHFGLANIGQDMFITGGYYNGTITRSCQIINSTGQRNVLKSFPDMNSARAEHCSLTIGDEIIVFGGDNGSILSSIECANVSGNGSWPKMGELCHKRLGATGAVLGGAAYVIGGWNWHGYLRAVDRFDPRAGNNCERKEPMKQSRYLAAAVEHDGRIYVTGGRNGRRDNDTALNTVEIYDPRADAWTYGPKMNTSRCGHALISDGDRLLVIGGDGSMEELVPGVDGQWAINLVKSPFLQARAIAI